MFIFFVKYFKKTIQFNNKAARYSSGKWCKNSIFSILIFEKIKKPCFIFLVTTNCLHSEVKQF